MVRTPPKAASRRVITGGSSSKDSESACKLGMLIQAVAVVAAALAPAAAALATVGGYVDFAGRDSVCTLAALGYDRRCLLRSIFRLEPVQFVSRLKLLD